MFDVPVQSTPTKKPSFGHAMIGLVLKSTFLTWMRNKQANKGKLTLDQMKAEVRDRRSVMLYHFSKTGKNSTKHSDSSSEAGTSVQLT